MCLASVVTSFQHQDGAAVENNDCDFNASCGIQQWEFDSASATKEQIYSDEKRNAIPRNKAEVSLLPAKLEVIVRSAVKEALEQVSLDRAPLINEMKCQIEMLESILHELTQADIGSNITRVPPRVQMRCVDFPDGTIHIVNAGIENIASVCYLNVYLQVIASCPTLPTCMWNTLSLSPERFPSYCAMATLIRSLVSENKTKETVDPTVFFKKITKACPNFFSISDSNQRK
jgi:hypothetical protein